MGSKVNQEPVELIGDGVVVVEHLPLVVWERAGEKVAATGRNHVYLLPQVNLELLKSSLGLLDRSLGLQGGGG